MREIVLDTESTGLDPKKGDRLVEIACIELHNHVPTGNYFQQYINPMRDVPQEAFAVHGLSYDFLKDHPRFESVYGSFLEFIGDSTLIIHNAKFDMKFLNFELGNVNSPLLTFDRVIDTLEMARKKFPGSPASLDALCKRFKIDLSDRTKHGALIDVQLLAGVYLELLGGRQTSFFSLSASQENAVAQAQPIKKREKLLEARTFPASPDELLAHQEFCGKLKNSLWLSERV